MNTEQIGQQGETPLMAAMRNGHFNVFKLLIENNSNVNTKNHSNETVLILAIDEKIPQHFLELLLSSEEIDLHVQSYFWGTALTYALFNKQFDKANLLLNKEKIFHLAQHPGALHWAVIRNNLEILNAFKNYQVDFNTTKYFKFNPPPDWVWKSMPSKSPFSFREKDITPLLASLNEENHSLLTWLLDHGANPNLEFEGEIPLVKAAEQQDLKALKILVNQGGNLNQLFRDDMTIKAYLLDNQYIDTEIKDWINNAQSKNSSSSMISNVDENYASAAAAASTLGRN